MKQTASLAPTSKAKHGLGEKQLATYTSRPRDVCRKMFKDDLWLSCRHKPAWVEFQLATSAVGMKRPPDPVRIPIEGASGRLVAPSDDFNVQMCRELFECGQTNDAVNALDLLVQRGCHLPVKFFYNVLKRCVSKKDVVLGQRIHALTLRSGYGGHRLLATQLIGLYASHRKLEEAAQVFSMVYEPDRYNWASIIFAHARHGEPEQAIRLYRQMCKSGVKPDNHVYLAVLKACANAGDLDAGKEVHAHLLASSEKPDVFVQTSLVDMYAKCGSIEDARGVFDRLPCRNVVTWTAMIAGYVQQGMGQQALSLYNKMQEEGVNPPDSVAYVCLLQACGSVGSPALHQGKQLHTQIKKRGLQADVVVGSSLLNMYAKCGNMEDARDVFDSLPRKNVVTWTTMIAGYAQQGRGQEALCLYSSMQQEGLMIPDSVTFVCLLQACLTVGAVALTHGRQLHAQIEEHRFQDDVVVGASLVNMYAKCSSIEDARRVFDSLTNKNVVTWNAMIAGYIQQGMGKAALTLYTSMKQEGTALPNAITFVCLLQACATEGIGALHQARQLHSHIQERRLHDDVLVGASLVNMYVKLEDLGSAQQVFDSLHQKDVVTWTAMIAGYAQQGMGNRALNLYTSMQQDGLAPPDSVTFVCLLQASASAGEEALHQGKQLHAQIREGGLQDDVVVGGSLVNMYAKCGSIKNAREVFDRLPDRNVVTWTSMIAGYAQAGMCDEAIFLYSQMQQEGITLPDTVTYVCLLQACATVAALPLGKRLHAQIGDQGLQADEGVGNALVNMYAKCGSMVDAQLVFDALSQRDIVAWGSLIAGYSRQGDSEVVFALLEQMRVEAVQPDAITFLSAMTVCSHLGLVDEGRQYFEIMTADYGITPTIEHYSCMVDLLGRAGYLVEALSTAKKMPHVPNATVWCTLLSACQKWGDVDIGLQAFQFAVSLDDKNASPYVSMSNIYAGAHMWEKAKEMQSMRLKCGARKNMGKSWCTDLNGSIDLFAVGETWQKKPQQRVKGERM